MANREAKKKFDKAWEAYWQGNYERALAFYEESLELDPSYLDARINYAGTLAAMGRHGEALPILRNLYRNDPGNQFHRRGMMEVLRATREWAELQEVAQQAVHQNSKDYEALNYLGWAILKQGNPERASNLFYRAIEMDEQYYSAWQGMGWAALYLRELREAIEAFSSAASVAHVTPDPPKLGFEALFGLGLAYVESGRGREALEVGNLMNSDNRLPAATGIVKARAFFRLGMAEAGLTEGEFALSQGAENLYLLLDMAFEYARFGDEANAHRLLEHVDRDTGQGTFDNYQIRCGRTTVLLVLKRYEDAIEETEELVSYFGEDENLRYDRKLWIEDFLLSVVYLPFEQSNGKPTLARRREGDTDGEDTSDRERPRRAYARPRRDREGGGEEDARRSP